LTDNALARVGQAGALFLDIALTGLSTLKSEIAKYSEYVEIKTPEFAARRNFQ
jgi:hypothetical protein